MIVLSLAEVAAATGGRLAGGADGAVAVTANVVTDSREVTPGCLFVALTGTRVDGHDFARTALESGAVAVLASHEVGGPAVLVDDQKVALGRLARAVVDRIPGLVVVGVTGSSGKTSTKDLIAAVLEGAGETVATAGSFNNEIGLPLTVLRCGPGTRYLVVEMGAREPGNIAYLCGIAPPRIAVELNVGVAHLGVFGAVEVTARTKAELVGALPGGGVAVLNADDPWVRAMPVPDGARTVFFGRASVAAAHDVVVTDVVATDVVATDVRLDDAARASFRLRTPAGEADVRLRVHGEHHVSNALAAAAVGLEAGLDVAEVARLLSLTGAASRWRMEVRTRRDGVTIINDAYNANPDSVRAALRALAAMTAGGRRGWVVLGEMLELGDASRAEHEEVGRVAAGLGVAHLVAVGGRAANWIRDGARSAGMPSAALDVVADRDTALGLLRERLSEGDVVLVKASRSVGLDVLAGHLLLPGADGDGAAFRPGEPAAGEDDARIGGLVTGEVRL